MLTKAAFIQLKDSNIVKYYYILKLQFSIWIF